MTARTNKQSQREATISLIRSLKHKSTEKYAVGGKLKEGHFAPKKVSLAQINLPPLEDDDDHQGN